MKKRIFFAGMAALMLVLTPALHAEVSTGERAPDFSLPDLDGKTQSLVAQQGKYVVLEWINPDCPFVKKHYDTGNMQDLQSEFTERGVIWFSIASSAPGKQGNYSAQEWRQIVTDQGIASTDVLLDPKGMVGHLYGAQTTPHMFVIDPDGMVIYQGAIDDTPSTEAADVETATNYVSQALEEAMDGEPVSVPSTKSYGCSVKYE